MYGTKAYTCTCTYTVCQSVCYSSCTAQYWRNSKDIHVISIIIKRYQPGKAIQLCFNIWTLIFPWSLQYSSLFSKIFYKIFWRYMTFGGSNLWSLYFDFKLFHQLGKQTLLSFLKNTKVFKCFKLYTGMCEKDIF